MKRHGGKEPCIRALRPRAFAAHGRIVSRLIATAVAIAAFAGMASLAAAASVELPSVGGTGGGAAPAPEANPPAGGAAPAPAPDVSVTQPPRPRLRTLRRGNRGSAVRVLQRALRKKRIRVRVDGVYGLGTKRAVMKLQRRWRVRRTGIASVGLQKRLGIRARGIAAPSAQTGQVFAVFPVAQDYAYSDDYGAPRGQGAHQGTDIIAPKGTPVYAVNDGAIDRLTRTERGLGGIYIWQRDARGTEYYYAHLHSVAPGLRDGSRVRAGEIIGTVGNTGDARYGADHLHFEYRPQGRSTNPFPHLVRVDPQRQAASSRRS